MKKRIFMLPVILMLALVLMMGCSDNTENNETTAANSTDTVENGSEAQTNEDGTISIDLSGGADAFVGFEPEEIALEVVRQGETQNLDFIGVSLDVLLTSKGITEFAKIELVISDMDENMDITEMAKADAGYFLAWSESGTPETPIRAFPKDAGTANLLTRNVTEIIITK